MQAPVVCLAWWSRRIASSGPDGTRWRPAAPAPCGGIEQPVEQRTEEEQRGKSRRQREAVADRSERVAHRADGQRRQHRRRAGEEENHAGAGAMLGPRQTADALRVDGGIDHRHEQARHRQQIHGPVYASGGAGDEAHEDAPAEQRQHGLPVKARQHPRAEKPPGGAEQEEDRDAVGGQRRGRAGVAREQRRHPDVDSGLDADVQEGPGRERQDVGAPERPTGSAEAAATGGRPRPGYSTSSASTISATQMAPAMA